MEVRVRGLSGFGDSLYLRAVLDSCFPEDKEQLVVRTNYPDIFPGYKTEDFSKEDVCAFIFSYLERKYTEGTNQWEDMLIAGKQKEPYPEFKLDFPCTKFQYSKPQLLVVGRYPSFGNGRGYNGFMIPAEDDFNKLVKSYEKEYQVYIINDKLPLQILFDLFYSANKVLCQQGWGTALAEGLNIPCDVIFTERAMSCCDTFISSIKPEKIFTRTTSKAVILP